jgi:hypothetical protein
MFPFIQRQRMQSIYGPTEAAVGPPDFNMSNINVNPGLGMYQTPGGNPDQYFENFAIDRARNNYLPGTTTTAPPNVKIGADDYLEGQISAKDRANLDLKRQDIQRKQDYGEQNLDIKRGGQDIQQQRTDILDFKARNPGMKVLTPKGGNYQFYDPIKGVTHDTGIPTGSLSREDELAITGQQRMDQIGARGDIQQSLGTQRGNQALANIAARTAGQKDIRNTAPVKPMLPTQERVQQNIRARQLINSNPDLAQFVTVDPTTGSFNITPPSEGYTGHSGPTDEQYQRIQEAIYGAGPARPLGDVNLPKSRSKIKSITPISNED